MDKGSQYANLIGRTHLVREEIRDRWTRWKEAHPLGIVGSFKEALSTQVHRPDQDGIPNLDEYSHIYR